MRGRIFYGWWIVGAMLVALMVGSGLTFWSFTVFIPPLEAEFGWSRAAVASAFSVGVVVSGIAGPFVGRVVDRLGARLPIVFGCLGTTATFFVLPHVTSLWQYLAVFGIQAFFNTWMMGLPFQWMLTQWFVRRRGFALGIATAGFGLGGSVFLPLLAWLIDAYGWRAAYQVSGVLTAVIFLPLVAFVVRDRPSDMGLQPDGDPEPPPSARPLAHLRVVPIRELVRSRHFWLLACVNMLFFGALDSYILHSVPFFESHGYSAAYAATLISVSAIIRTPARVAAGWAIDRMGSLKPVALAVSLTHAFCLGLLVVNTSQPALIVFTVLWGLAGGFGPLLVSIAIGRTFGSGSFATASGAMMAAESTMAMAMPPLGGYLFDRLGSYDVAFSLYTGMFLLAAGAWWLYFAAPARRPEPVVAPVAVAGGD